MAKPSSVKLRDHRKVWRAWLGVQLQALPPALAEAVGPPEDHGALVDSITDGSPLSAAYSV